MAETKARRVRPRVADSPLQVLVKNRLKERRTALEAGPRTVGDIATTLGIKLATLNSYLDGRTRMAVGASVTPQGLAEAVGLDTADVERAVEATAAALDRARGRA